MLPQIHDTISALPTSLNRGISMEGLLQIANVRITGTDTLLGLTQDGRLWRCDFGHSEGDLWTIQWVRLQEGPERTIPLKP